MANTFDIGIKQDDRKEIADGLSRLLADTYTLYLKAHSFTGTSLDQQCVRIGDAIPINFEHRSQ